MEDELPSRANHPLPNLNLRPEDMASKDYAVDGAADVREMHRYLSDSHRINTYREAILSNRHLFKNKIVLEVNCRSGILSMFAAKAGAKKVYAINCSNVMDFAERIFKANKFDNKIIAIKGFIEETQFDEKIDVIISDWMGDAILFKSSLDVIIFAREHFLQPNGIIFPDLAKLYIVGLYQMYFKSDNFDWWEDVYDFDMSVMRDWAKSEPRVIDINPLSILTSPELVGKLNLNEITREQFNIDSFYTLYSEKRGIINAIGIYFDVEFTKSHKPMYFSTAPGTFTNFHQTLCFMDEPTDTNDAPCGRIRISEIDFDTNNVEISISFYTQKFKYCQRWVMRSTSYLEYNVPLQAFGIERKMIKSENDESDTIPTEDAKKQLTTNSQVSISELTDDTKNEIFVECSSDDVKMIDVDDGSKFNQTIDDCENIDYAFDLTQLFDENCSIKYN